MIISCVSFMVFLAAEIQGKKEEDYEKIQRLISCSPIIMTKALMLIYSGYNTRNSLVESFEDYLNDKWLGDSFRPFVSAIQNGMSLDSAVQIIGKEIDHKLFLRMLQRMSLYEKTGNQVVLYQLQQDLSDLHEEKYQLLSNKMNQANLMSVVPSILNLLILMILLMAPILIGGI